MAKVNAKRTNYRGAESKFPIEMDIDIISKIEDSKMVLQNLSIFFNKWYNHKELSSKLLAMTKV
jgi:hypothetical protein